MDIDIKKVNEIDENWNENIKDISLTREFGKAYENEGEVIFLNQNNEKALVIIKKKFCFIFSRAQIFTNSTDLDFLKKIIEYLKKRKIPYARIGNSMFGIEKEINLPNSNIIKRHTFIIDLNKKEEEIWNNFDKKLRNIIRKAEKEGVIIKEIENEKELEEYYKLSKKTEKEIRDIKKRKTFFIQSYNFFKELYENKIGRFFIAIYNNKIIAGSLFLVGFNKSIYFQSFIDREFKDKQAQSLIQWEAIKKFKKEGILEFDLGGVTLGLNENDSRFYIYEFKRKFNGKLKEFYNIEIEINKFKKIQEFLIKKMYGN